MRTELEVALSSADGPDLRRAVERALAEEERLERLLADLLLLATVEESDAPTDLVPLDELVRSEAARPRRLPVTVLEPLPSIAVPGRRVQLERAVGNVLDNATRHARSTVQIALAVDGDDIVLRVDDDGPGIPEADRERVFERFARLDEGRARSAGGAGLGLALVRTIVQRHGGTVAAMSSDLGGARLHTRLPARAPWPHGRRSTADARSDRGEMARLADR
jgi:signal transduction histidine kinase